MKKQMILIVEDEIAIRDMLQFALTPAGFHVVEASNAKEAELQIAKTIPDLILLDWMLPGVSGIDFTKQLKKNKTTQSIPIIMLTARAEEENKIKGLTVGADDYVTKPFSPRELIARIKTVLRRGVLMNPDSVIQVRELQLNVDTHEVTIQTQRIELKPIEYKILHFFVTHQNRVYSREQLLMHIWGGETNVDERTVDVQIKRLRNCLQPFGYDAYIRTVRGSGYQFTEKDKI